MILRKNYNDGIRSVTRSYNVAASMEQPACSSLQTAKAIIKAIDNFC